MWTAFDLFVLGACWFCVGCLFTMLLVRKGVIS